MEFFFLSLIERIVELDPIMQEHTRCIKNGDIDSHYLGHNKEMIELIQMLGLEIKNSTINKIKEATYFSIILDCTLDTSHKRTNVY